MPNNPSVIARPTETGFAGRFVWNDGHPSQRLPLLLALHFSAFGGDLDAMTRFLIDEHPAGWSQLGHDPTADTGWMGLVGSRPGETRFVCHCHGERADVPLLVTEQTADPDEDGWVYLLRPDGIEVWHPTEGGAWRREPVIPWESAPADEGTVSTSVVDGRDALAFVIIRPGSTDGAVSIEAAASGMSKPAAAHVLRHVAAEFEKGADEFATPDAVPVSPDGGV